MTDEQIIAYVDGELGPIEALRFERAMEADPMIAASVDRHRKLRGLVTGRFAPIADEPLPDRLTELLNRNGNVVAFPRKKPWRQGGRYAALAATLVAGLVVGQLLPRTATEPIGQKGGRVVAQGELANALDTQLASAIPQAAAYQVGVSFRSIDNRYCRTFSGAAGAGIGCHGGEGWALERFVASDQADTNTAYRQAASPSAEVLAAAQEMMSGAPLDAVQERRARERAWVADKKKDAE